MQVFITLMTEKRIQHDRGIYLCPVANWDNRKIGFTIRFFIVVTKQVLVSLEKIIPFVGIQGMSVLLRRLAFKTRRGQGAIGRFKIYIFSKQGF